jgi:drug/metabolite transporter (DMT)-like permease
MFALLWIPATLAAATLQVARNALQRGLMGTAGPWGATLVRFLFGLPFSLLFAAGAVMLTPGARPDASPVFWASAMSGALAQLLATAALLVGMRRAGFAVATALQQSSLPLSAILGLMVFHDRLSAIAWIGVAVATCGLAVLTWPRNATGPQPLTGALFALLSGLCFGFSLNAFRHAGLTLEPHHPIYSALLSVAAAQAAQATVLTAVLAGRDRGALRAIVAAWRESLAAGLFGALASAGWFIAVTLAPAAPVRALGVVETPIAALAGRRLFRERLHTTQILAGGAVLAGVVLTSLR